MSTTTERRVCTLHHSRPCPRGLAYVHYYATEMAVPARDIERGDRAAIGHMGDMTPVCALRKDGEGVHLADAVDVALGRFQAPVATSTVLTVWRVTSDPRKR